MTEMAGICLNVKVFFNIFMKYDLSYRNLLFMQTLVIIFHGYLRIELRPSLRTTSVTFSCIQTTLFKMALRTMG